MECVDVTGEVCPRPALIVRRRLSDLEPDDELLVRGDYPPAKRNLRRTCTKHGYDVEDRPPSEDRDGGFELLIRPTEAAGSRRRAEDDDRR
ncbi:sulfurtransferase TusA family protein [Natrinema salifodinae]|uniref:tRNA 2-thiouridine synthesizing protein A n=1 Tax=Natrinema salifodinae TaxID=1202768 RepID=A0A1I0QR82_9EURY|nr:sulfurtransferase TusA family protein [Natrinema salifodinae]SEW30073.1 tRNA 2-thiouridine synthesizing protein A [Natrinema salifodinae]